MVSGEKDLKESSNKMIIRKNIGEANMSISITTEDIKITIEKPDKLINCEFIGLCFYIKKIEGKGELLVVAKKESENQYDIKCFNWMNSMGFTMPNT